MKRILAALTVATVLAVGGKAHAQTSPEVDTWTAAVARAQAEAWDIAIWNQAVVNAEVGPQSWDCHVMLVSLVANGADRHELRRWLYIGRRESNCFLGALADRPRTGDYSVCYWQVNYYGGLRAGRTMAFGPPELLRSSPDACSRAALALRRANGFAPWG